MKSFWGRKICVFGFYLFLISIVSISSIEIASMLIRLCGLSALLGKVCNLACDLLA